MTTAVLLLPLPSLEPIDASRQSLVKQAVQESLRQKVGKLLILVRFPDTSSFTIDGQWHQLQALLCSLYVTQLNVTYAANAPLFDCTIVFDGWCNYSVGLECAVTLAFTTEQDVSEVNAWNQQRNIAIAVHKLILDNPVNPKQQATNNSSNDNNQIFDHTVVGGTFDHIHAGHKILLTMTALLAKKSITVGVTDDSMLVSKKHRELIASTESRIENVKRFLHVIRRGIEYVVVPISDPYGPTITDPKLQAIVVSKETEKGGDAVNVERAKRDYSQLALKIIDVISSDNASVNGQDMGALKISSTWIREYIAQQQQQQ
ncbi:hypothetical protein BDB00DRAFT_836151 [Zychaea mexicana]|uniref:uncharacterized protein n=1 Tax=Zychaea mexicana TaxID=64656 RepID=UPI0022FF3879|nr:uncharacterized protein BDB00DRAFT_836151 [Zychaea mexicana]KAI9490790.1 hypothetical protein BDB00DRAFT_836151 [Zychaea mexicana]